MALCEQIDGLDELVEVHVSNNDKSDSDVRKMIDSLDKKYLIYHENEENVGIDLNHAKVYDYVTAKWVLCLADDDMIAPKAIHNLIDIINKDSTPMFYILNSMLINNGEVTDSSLYNFQSETVKFNAKQSIRYFTYFTHGRILPLLPFYGGIVVNMHQVKKKYYLNTKYVGSYHYYIATLWDLLIRESGSMGIITEPMVYIGMDDDKTWFEYEDSVYNNLTKAYEHLPVPQNVRRDILQAFEYQRFGGRLNKILFLLGSIKSIFWKLN